MRVIEVTHEKRASTFYLLCAETKRSININANGAKKVARVCETPIEKYSQEEYERELKRFKG